MPRFPYDEQYPGPQENGRALRPRETLDPAVDATHLKELLGVVGRHWWLLLAVSAAIFAISTYMVFSSRPTYQAQAVIRLADVRRAYTGGFDDYSTQAPLAKATNPIASELEVLLGRTVLGEVVDREGLRLMVAPHSRLPYKFLTDVQIQPNASPSKVQLQFNARDLVVRTAEGEVRAPYGLPVEVAGVTFTVRAAPGRGEAELWLVPREMAIDYLAESLNLSSRGNTTAVSVRYTSTDPFYSQRVVNAAVEVFRDHNARAARQQAEMRREFLQQQLRSNEIQLTAAQDAFGAFQAREDVYSSSERLLAQEQELVAVATRREELDAEHRMYVDLLGELERTPHAKRADVLRTVVSAAGIATNPIVSRLYSELAGYESEIDRLTTGALGSTADNPDVQRLRSLIESTESRLIAAIQSQILAIGARVASLDSLRERTAAGMRRLPEARAEELRLTQQLEALGRVRDKLTADLHEARMAEAVEMGQVQIVYLAPLPIRRASASPARTLGVGLVLGLIFGFAAAFLREMLDTTIRSQDELRAALGLQVLAVVPPLTPSRGVLGRLRQRRLRKVTGARTRSVWSALNGPIHLEATEAYRVLRSNLIFARSEHGLKRLVVTSAVANEGKTTTAVNLAVTFAQHGTRVLLVDCDLRDAGPYEDTDNKQDTGLVQVLAQGAPLDQAVRGTVHENLFLVPAGSDRGREMPVDEQRLAETLDRFASDFGLIILDAPPVLDAADSMLIGRMADACILVVRAGETERALPQQARRQLELVGVTVVGGVLNDPAGKAKDHRRAGQFSTPHLTRRVRWGREVVPHGSPSPAQR